MSILNVEIKARCSKSKKIKAILESRNAKYKGIDHQVDTYFKAAEGRLKLREGNIENTLIHYLRPNQAGPKQSQVSLYHLTLPETQKMTGSDLLKNSENDGKPSPERENSLKTVLSKAIGILTVVDKHRAIYFIDNVKFHVDVVKDLGDFVEVEAIDKDGSIGQERLLEQVNFYLKLFEIDQEDLIDRSYSDMIMEKG